MVLIDSKFGSGPLNTGIQIRMQLQMLGCVYGVIFPFSLCISLSVYLSHSLLQSLFFYLFLVSSSFQLSTSFFSAHALNMSDYVFSLSVVNVCVYVSANFFGTSVSIFHFNLDFFIDSLLSVHAFVLFVPSANRQIYYNFTIALVTPNKIYTIGEVR